MNNNSIHPPCIQTGSQSHLKTIFSNGLVFLLPFSLLISSAGVSLCSFAFILATLLFLRAGPPVLRRHWQQIRWVLSAFLLHFLCVWASYLLRPGESLGTLEKPLRMLLGSSALLYVLLLRPNRKSLWWGVMGGACASAALVLYQRWGLGIIRPGGQINPITFGDLSLCLGLLSLMALIDFRASKYAFVPVLAGLTGLISLITTGARGGFVALIVALLVMLKHGHNLRAKSVAVVTAVVLGLVAGSYVMPQTGLHARVAEGVDDIHAYFEGGSSSTSIGVRFELWRAAAHLIGEHPFIGSGIESYRQQLYVQTIGAKDHSLFLELPHLHNDVLQVLVTGGMVDFIAWGATLLAPLLFFLNILKQRPGASQVALAMTGVLLVLSYVSFGFTEVIFWSMKSSLFYALMVFLLMGLCLNAKEDDEK